MTKTLTAGTYYLLAKGLNGCEAFDSQFVSAVPLLDTLMITSQKIDCAHPVGFVRIENVQAGFDYSITDQANNLVADTQLQTSVPNTYQIQAIHLASSCPLTKTAVVPIDTISPNLSILEMDSIVCDHREIKLGSMVDDTVIYQWSTTNGRLIGITDNSTARLDLPGFYRLDVESLTNSCVAAASILVEEKFSNLNAMFLTGIDATCLGEDDAVLIIDSLRGGTGPYQFSINDEFYTSQNVFQYLSPGEYQVYVQDVNGCQYDTLFNLERVPMFVVDLSEKDQVLNLGDSLSLNLTTDLRSVDISQIIWYLPDSVACQDCFEQIVSPLQNTSYQVAIQSSGGCIITDTVFVRVADRTGIYIPNAFTPNGDRINDFLEVFTGNNILRINAFEIFDRWGNNIFSAFDFLPGELSARWDGMYRGEPLNPGVYIYKVQASDVRGSTKSTAGDVTLLR
jgi:gliding motility-associated-like protein